LQNIPDPAGRLYSRAKVPPLLLLGGGNLPGIQFQKAWFKEVPPCWLSEENAFVYCPQENQVLPVSCKVVADIQWRWRKNRDSN